MAHFESFNTSDGSATPLGGGGSITPIVINTQIDGTLAYTVKSDQSGTLTIAQSFDGINWDYIPTGFPLSVTGGTGYGGQVSVVAPQVQISYLNGGTPQTYMRLFVRTFGIKTG